jgi:hypothetical protein
VSQPIQRLAERYLAFAAHEARGVSPIYEACARSVAASADLLDRLIDLPEGKQQPNLLFAATRSAVGLPDEGADFAAHSLSTWEAVESMMLTRSTQTNEPGRCACLLPVLAQIEGPLALLEVGASAGLCLLPDRYGYDYGRVALAAPETEAPVFPCAASQNTPLPIVHPQIAWRAGLDLEPLDVCDEADMDWLRVLVWPEHDGRRARLDAAISVARRVPPRLVAGDLVAATEALAREAPAGTRLVIFHTAVLSYVPVEARAAFATLVGDLDAEWISNEGQRVLPQVAAPDDRPGTFVLARNGHAIARTGPHGQFLDWVPA